MTTDTLIATICAEAQADLERDPQAVIRRLKQDLRAARQAATKARNYAERIRDGHRCPEFDAEIDARQDAATQALVQERNAALAKVAELTVVIARRDETIRTGRAAFARATRRAINAERERDALDEQIGAHRASRSHVDDSEPDTGPTVYALEYLELMRAHRIIRRLLTADDGRDAAVGNRMLAKIQEINDAVDVKQNRGRAA